jgi:hypothetical protein
MRPEFRWRRAKKRTAREPHRTSLFGGSYAAVSRLHNELRELKSDRTDERCCRHLAQCVWAREMHGYPLNQEEFQAYVEESSEQIEAYDSGKSIGL